MSRSLVRSLAVAGIAASALTLNALPAAAAPVGFTVDQETEQLASIDAGTSVLTGIGGDDGAIDSLALACDGALYGIERIQFDLFMEGSAVNGLDPSDQLVRIDKATGAITPIGEFGLQNGEYGMAFAPDGTLWVSSDDELYRADITTGALTPVGSFLDAEAEMNSLAFNAAGDLYGYDDDSGRLYRIDPATAVATEVGDAEAGMGDVLGLDFDAAGTLWAIARTDGTGTATFDLTTGEGQFTPNESIAAQGLALTSLPCETPATTTTTSTSTPSTTAPTTSTTAAPRAAAAAVRAQPRFAG
jgi:streptogramin lyase